MHEGGRESPTAECLGAPRPDEGSALPGGGAALPGGGRLGQACPPLTVIIVLPNIKLVQKEDGLK